MSWSAYEGGLRVSVVWLGGIRVSGVRVSVVWVGGINVSGVRVEGIFGLRRSGVRVEWCEGGGWVVSR